MLYYEIIDGKIGRYTENETIANANGLRLTTDDIIVLGSDGERYLASQCPCPINPVQVLLESLRHQRDSRLSDTDKYLLPDYPISESDLAAVKSYRQALRDISAQPGAPWDGGDDETPWPLPPEL